MGKTRLTRLAYATIIIALAAAQGWSLHETDNPAKIAFLVIVLVVMAYGLALVLQTLEDRR